MSLRVYNLVFISHIINVIIFNGNTYKGCKNLSDMNDVSTTYSDLDMLASSDIVCDEFKYAFERFKSSKHIFEKKYGFKI